MSDISRSPPSDTSGIVRRCEERASTNWIALVRLPDGTEIPCNVKDVSPSGARLGIPGTVPLPEMFMLKVVGRDFVCQVRLAWRRGNFAGVRIERIGKLTRKHASTASAPATASPGYTALGPRKSRISTF